MVDIATKQLQKLAADFGLYPITAAEVEFYLIGSAQTENISIFWENVTAACFESGIALFNFGQEDGLEQYEVSIFHSNDPLKTIHHIAAIKMILAQCAFKQHMSADFSAKPFTGRSGSGLHIHIHLEDTSGKNVFFKDDTTISDALKFSLGGMISWLPDCMAMFAPNANSYARYTDKSNAPTTVSWGANNRTVALRLPMSAQDNKRIEHRVSGADADPMCVMAVILAAIHFGLKHKLNPGAQMYGDATLAMYDLPRLPTSLEEATALLKASKNIADYFSVSDLLPTR